MPEMKILVVDNSEARRRILTNALGKLGYANVDSAEDGQVALNKLRAGGFELMFTDWNMPVMDGLTLVKNVRNMPALEGIPIIMVTTEAAKDDIIAAIKAGVTNYVIKPFTVDTIREKLEATLEKMGVLGRS